MRSARAYPTSLPKAFLIVFATFTPKKRVPIPGGPTGRVHGPEMLAGASIIL